MVLEEISQLIEDCNEKREILSEYRHKINQLQKDLLKVAAGRLNKDDLTDLEHYQNQFHIQLINIHDVKHDLKIFQHQLKAEAHLHDSTSPEMIETHKSLTNAYDQLKTTLDGLQQQFEAFAGSH
ncbi:MAG: hypothetical protein QM727_13000 [Niabella sp.]